jgi:hypothetical protein
MVASREFEGDSDGTGGGRIHLVIGMPLAVELGVLKHPEISGKRFRAYADIITFLSFTKGKDFLSFFFKT